MLVALVVALVAVLSTVLAGLADGLVADGTSGVRALPFSHLAMEPNSKAVFSRSTLHPEAVETWRQVPGAQATPVGVSFANGASVNGGPSIDLALFGLERDSFLATRPEALVALDGAPGMVLAAELQDQGVKVGDRYRIGASDVVLPVLGFTYAGSYGHVPLAFTSLVTWQSIQYGSDARGRFSAIALNLPEGADVSAVNNSAGTEIMTKNESYAGSPGFSAETSTMSLIRVFLLAISALIVGAFFTVLTVQRTRQIGLLKALGASSGYVLRDGLGQMTIVVVAATAVGCAAGAAITTLLGGGSVPITLSVATVVTSAALLIVTGIVGSLVPFRRITAIEPAIALGVEA